MPRNLSLVFTLTGLLAIGCGTSKPSPARLNDAASTAGTRSAAHEFAKPVPSAGTIAPSPSPQAQSKPSLPASPLRELAAKYLESDGHGGWRKNEQAATDLEKLSPEETQQLWTLLTAPQAEVRRGAAVFLLAQFDPANRDQVAAFAALLDDSDRLVRARAIDAVRQFSRSDQLAALPRLTAMLDPEREDRAENRVAVARLISTLKQDASAALPSLASVADSDPDAKVRAGALAAAASIGTSAPIIQLLAKGLSDREASVRVVAAVRLKQIGHAASPAASQLALALDDSSGDVAEAAADALIRIGAPAVEPLARQLSSNSVSARKLALACLAKLGLAAKPAMSQIEKCKQDADPQVRQLAEAALKRIAGQ